MVLKLHSSARGIKAFTTVLQVARLHLYLDVIVIYFKVWRVLL